MPPGMTGMFQGSLRLVPQVSSRAVRKASKLCLRAKGKEMLEALPGPDGGPESVRQGDASDGPVMCDMAGIHTLG